jgi:hypothetical protein
VKEAATQDKAACPEQTKAGEKHAKLRSVTEHPQGIVYVVQTLKIKKPLHNLCNGLA